MSASPTKQRTYSNASGSVTIRNTTTPRTSIPSLSASSRRTSLQSFPTTESVSSRATSSAYGQPKRTVKPPSTVGSKRTPGPVNVTRTPSKSMFLGQPIQLAEQTAPTTADEPRTRVQSMSATPKKGGSQMDPPALLASPSISVNLTSPSPLQKTKQPLGSKSPAAMAPRTPSKEGAKILGDGKLRLVAETPPRGGLHPYSPKTTPRSHTTPVKPNTSTNTTTTTTPKTLHRQPSTPGAFSFSPPQDSLASRKMPTPASIMGGKVLSNGTHTAVATDDGSGNAFWDADEDMSMEMVTDINDGDVDEEVCRPILLAFRYSLPGRCLVPLTVFWRCTLARFCTTNVFSSVLKRQLLPNSMLSKLRFGCCGRTLVKTPYPLLRIRTWITFAYAEARKRKDSGAVIVTILMMKTTKTP